MFSERVATVRAQCLPLEVPRPPPEEPPVITATFWFKRISKDTAGGSGSGRPLQTIAQRTLGDRPDVRRLQNRLVKQFVATGRTVYGGHGHADPCRKLSALAHSHQDRRTRAVAPALAPGARQLHGLLRHPSPRSREPRAVRARVLHDAAIQGRALDHALGREPAEQGRAGTSRPMRSQTAAGSRSPCGASRTGPRRRSC